MLELSLKRTKLTSETLRTIEDSWSKMPLKKRIMRKLDLSENPDLDSDSTLAIKTILETMPFIQELDLSDTLINNEGLSIILNSLKLSLSLKNLQMNNC